MESRDNLAERQLLIDACLKKDIAGVESQLDLVPSGLNRSSRFSALHFVCDRLGDLTLLKVLTSRKCEVDVKDSRGCTPLHYACFNGHIDLVKYLILTLKCNPNVRDNDGKTPLHMACSFIFSDSSHARKIVEFLTMEGGSDCNAVTSNGATPLMLLLCSKRNNIQSIVEHLVHKCHCNTSLKNGDGNTALHLACMRYGPFLEKRKLQIVRAFVTVIEGHEMTLYLYNLDGIFSLNYKNDSPIEIAVANNFLEIASFLLKRCTQHVTIPLLKDFACMKLIMLENLKFKPGKYHACKPKVLTEFRRMNCMLAHVTRQYNYLNESQRHSHMVSVRLELLKTMYGVLRSLELVADFLHYACGKRTTCSDLNVLELLKEYYIPDRRHLINHKDKSMGFTPLHYACYYGLFDIMVYLVNDYGADVNAKTTNGYSPLHLISVNMHHKLMHSLSFVPMALEMVRNLTRASCDSNATFMGNTPLMCLADDRHRARHSIAHHFIFDCNCDLTIQNNEKNTALHIACQTGNGTIVQMIADRNNSIALLTMKNNEGNTPLHLACREGKLDIVNIILNTYYKYSGQYEVNYNGYTPLQLAIVNNHYQIISTLLQVMNPKQDKNGRMILRDACKNTDIQLLQCLVRSSYRIMKNAHGDTLLHIACKINSISLCEVLFEACCDVNIKNKHGDTPLHVACQTQGIQLCKLLLTADCNINVMNNNGDTPLHIACEIGSIQLCEILLEACCDVNVKNNNGDTPFHVACEFRSIHLCEILLKANCGVDIKNKNGNTPLHIIACQLGSIHLCKLLLKACCDVNIKNNNGDTALHVACQTQGIQLCKFLLTADCNINIMNNNGDTPLHIACEIGSIQLCEILLEACCDVNVKNNNGDTPFHVACEFRSIHLCEVLLKANCDVDIRNKKGDTPLHIACNLKSIHLCELLLEACCDVNIKNNNGDTALHVACQMNTTNLCEILLEACCDINIKDRNGNTPLNLAFSFGNFEIAQLLINDPQIKTGLKNTAGDTLLHIACRTQHCTPEMVNYVLAVVKSDPNAKNSDEMTPIQLTTNARKIHELIRYGANPMDVYSTSNVKMTSKYPPQPLVKIFVVGNAAVGKSTLIAALQKELSRIVKILTPVKKVSGVHEKTAGIIPCDFESKKYGEVTLYDFAGQREYYSTHAALLQNSIESSPPVFLIVVNLCESYKEIKKTILYWLSFLENQCTTVNEYSRPHVIVIGSHADILESKGEKIQEKASLLDHIKGLPHFKSLEIITFISMDCQYSQSAGMKKLREQLQSSCKKLRIKDEIRFNTHCFMVYLLDKFRDSTAVTLNQIFAQVDSERNVASESNPLFFLPDCLSSLFDLCFELNDRGHILFLKDRQTLMKSWVVLDKQSLLNEVLGTIFAPEGLKEYCTLASNTGVVPISKIAEKFPKYDTTIIVGFLTHLEFCHEVSDEEVVVQLINEESQSTLQATNKKLETYLFFPALVKVEAPDGVWKHKPQFNNYFGWMLQCSRPEQFFTSRFLEVLILRLAFSFALSSTSTNVVTDGPSLKRKCTIWKNGIFWGDRNGVETLVEVRSDNKEVIVLMRSFQENFPAFLQLRSSIIQRVLTTVSDFCAKVSTAEYFIDPFETNSYPLNSKTLFNAQQVFNAIVLRSVKSAYIVSDNGESLPLETLLTFEPFVCLGYKTLSKMFSMDNSHCKKQIPDHIITSLPENFAQKSDVLLKIIRSGDRQADVSDDTQSRSNDLVHSLKAWRDNCDGTYHCLRQTFDQYSICAGRNLLVK